MNVGPMIRARRMQLHLTLTELAKRSGMSVPFLSQVERGHSGITVVSLVKIAEALGVNANYFLQSDEPDAPVRRAAEQHFFSLAESKMRLARIGSVNPDRALEPLLVIFPPKYQTEALKHAGEEFIYVLEGRLTVVLGKKKHVLTRGDTSHFKSGQRHKWINESDEEVRFIWIGTPKLL